MDEVALVSKLSNVIMMGGDRLCDLLAPSEIAALAHAVWTAFAETAPAPVPSPSMHSPALDFMCRDLIYPLHVPS